MSANPAEQLNGPVYVEDSKGTSMQSSRRQGLGALLQNTMEPKSCVVGPLSGFMLPARNQSTVGSTNMARKVYIGFTIAPIKN